MILPDFIVGGAPRSGTTWLWHALDRHPCISMAQPVRPEPKFFLLDDLFEKGLAYYSRTWFEPLPGNGLRGEKSTNYLESAVAARRIRECLPQVKMLFLLRDPVERAYSNYLYSRSNDLEELSFMDALRSEREREVTTRDELRYARPHALVSRGCYARLLLPWQPLLDDGRVLCARYEDLASEPSELLRLVHEFLGVSPRPRDGDGIGRINAVPGPSRPEMPSDARRWLEERFAAENETLGSLLGPDFQLWQYGGQS